MEDILNSELVLQIVIFLAGLLSAGIVLGSRALIESFKKSSNKLDDQLIPLLEQVAAALEEKK